MHPGFEWSKIGQFSNWPVYKWSDAILDFHFKNRHPVFKWIGCLMLTTMAICTGIAQPFENHTILIPNFKLSGLQMVGFRIPLFFQIHVAVKISI